MLKLYAASIARTAGPAATAWLAAKGIVVADPNLAVLLALGVYGAAQVWSLLHKAGKVKA